MTRLIEEVYKQIDTKIPESEIQFRTELKKYVESLWNKAPEVRMGPEVYIPFIAILEKYINPHAENLPQWQLDIINIFNDTYTENFDDMNDYNYMNHTMNNYN